MQIQKKPIKKLKIAILLTYPVYIIAKGRLVVVLATYLIASIDKPIKYIGIQSSATGYKIIDKTPQGIITKDVKGTAIKLARRE